MARKKLVESTFLSIIDYGDHLYMHALLRKFDYVYHAALRFITGAESRTHHCIRFESLDRLSLHQRRKLHMYLFIIKALLGKFPSYTSNLLMLHINSRCTRSVVLVSRSDFIYELWLCYLWYCLCDSFVWNCMYCRLDQVSLEEEIAISQCDFLVK